MQKLFARDEIRPRNLGNNQVETPQKKLSGKVLWKMHGKYRHQIFKSDSSILCTKMLRKLFPKIRGITIEGEEKENGVSVGGNAEKAFACYRFFPPSFAQRFCPRRSASLLPSEFEGEDIFTPSQKYVCIFMRHTCRQYPFLQSTLLKLQLPRKRCHHN